MNTLDIKKLLLKNTLIPELGIPDHAIKTCFEYWNQPHRHYHGNNHLIQLFDLISKKTYPDLIFHEILELIALFHDAVYDPRSKQNEELSADFFKRSVANKNEDYEIIYQAILDTKIVLKPECGYLSSEFLEMDVHSLINGDISTVLKNEMLIHREYQIYHIKDYVKGRTEFFQTLINRPDLSDFQKRNMLTIVDFLKSFRPKIGLYAGSFNPFHIGHLNVLEKAEAMFDKVIVASCINPDKVANDKRSLRYELPFHHIIDHEGLLCGLYQYLEEDYDVTLIRGLRNGSDLQYEMNMFRTLQDSIPNIKVVFLVCDRNYEHLSSSMYRQLESFKQETEHIKYAANKYRYNTGYN